MKIFKDKYKWIKIIIIIIIIFLVISVIIYRTSKDESKTYVFYTKGIGLGRISLEESNEYILKPGKNDDLVSISKEGNNICDVQIFLGDQYNSAVEKMKAEPKIRIIEEGENYVIAELKDYGYLNKLVTYDYTIYVPTPKS